MAELKMHRLIVMLMPIILAFRQPTEEGLGFEARLDNVVSSTQS